MGLIGVMRFTIYDIFDDTSGGSEYQMLWDKNYRFDPKLKDLGQIECIDFEKRGCEFLTGSNLGWICIWDLKFKFLLRKFRNFSVEGPFESVNIIRTLNDYKHIIVYNKNSKRLVLHSIKTITEEDEAKNSVKGPVPNIGMLGNGGKRMPFLNLQGKKTPGVLSP